MALTDLKINLNGARVSITVIACGPSWLIVEKPCGISIHNDPGNDLCAHVLKMVKSGRLAKISRDINALHAVHRIDRDTSGLVLLAGDSETLAFFGRQFSAKSVEKRYLALVHGAFENIAERQWLEWNWPLTAAAAGRKDPSGKGPRMPCATRFRLISQSPHYSLIESEPLTGRKHQIRRHAKLAGHPVVGDRRYSSQRSLDYLQRHHNFQRLALHAHLLAICLPGKDSVTTFQSGGLPEQMARLLEMDKC